MKTKACLADFPDVFFECLEECMIDRGLEKPEDCTGWKDYKYSEEPRTLSLKITSCSQCPHHVEDGRVDPWCNEIGWTLDVDTYKHFPVWCRLEKS